MTNQDDTTSEFLIQHLPLATVLAFLAERQAVRSLCDDIDTANEPLAATERPAAGSGVVAKTITAKRAA